MKPFILLLVVFGLTLIITKISTGDWVFVLSGNVAMSMMLLFTAMGHFKFTKGMAMMLPDVIPAREQLVYITGILEIVLAIGILIPSLRYTAGIVLIFFLVILLPANVYAATHNLDYEKGTYTGSGLAYLWFRIPLQVLFIVWTWYFAVSSSSV